MEILSEYLKICPVCEIEYEARRLNQTYCSIQCKARFNNYKSKNKKLTYAAVTEKKNKILWKNREVLSRYDGQEVSVETLLDLGFKLRYVTNFYLDQKIKKNVMVVYDYAYIFINENTIKIQQYDKQ